MVRAPTPPSPLCQGGRQVLTPPSSHPCLPCLSSHPEVQTLCVWPVGAFACLSGQRRGARGWQGAPVPRGGHCRAGEGLSWAGTRIPDSSPVRQARFGPSLSCPASVTASFCSPEPRADTQGTCLPSSVLGVLGHEAGLAAASNERASRSCQESLWPCPHAPVIHHVLVSPVLWAHESQTLTLRLRWREGHEGVSEELSREEATQG